MQLRARLRKERNTREKFPDTVDMEHFVEYKTEARKTNQHLRRAVAYVTDTRRVIVTCRIAWA